MMKLIKKLFDARSPIWQLIFALFFVGFFSYAAQAMVNDVTSTEAGGFQFTFGPEWLIFPGLFLLASIGASMATRSHNRRHPHSKISIWQIFPPEVMKSDEMFEHASREAARRVYLYSNVTLPLLVLAVLFYRMSPLALGTVLAIYLAGYYLTYLRAIWPYLAED